MKRFLAIAIPIAIVHFVIAVTLVLLWTRTNEPVDHPSWGSFSYCAGVLIFVPLYLVKAIRDHVQFFAVIAINSAIWATIFGIVFAPIRRLWLWIPIVLIALPLLWFGTLTEMGNALEKRVDQAWATRLGPRIPIAQRFPRTQANESARAVDQFADKLLGQDFERVRSSIPVYLSAQFARGDDIIEDRPANVEFFIVAHRLDLDGLEGALQTGDPPRWDIDLDQVDRPKSLRYYTLQRLVLLDALESARNNDFASARHYLDLAQRLTASLRKRPEIFAVVSAIAATESQLGVARKFPSSQSAELQQFDARERLIDAREAEAWTMRRAVQTMVGNPLLDILVRPYARLCAIARSQDELKNSLALRNSGRCVFKSPKPVDETSALPSPINADPWTYSVSLALRANRLQLDFDGTEKIAALKRSPQPGTSPSTCPDRKWIFDGRVVHLEPPLPAPSPLPTKHVITAARTSTSGTSPATGQTAPSSE